MKPLFGIKDIDPIKWDILVKVSPVATWFQTREAFGFFNSLSSFETFVVGIESLGVLKGLVVGCIQKDGGKVMRFFSRRAIILGGPLFSEDIEEEELTALLTAVKDNLRKKAIYIETRNFNDYSRWRRVFEGCGFDYEPHFDIHVDATTLKVVNQHLGKSRKRDIRVSLRDGASLVISPTLKQVRDYYSILSDLYRTKIKTPLPQLEYFEKLFEVPSAKFFLVEYNDVIIGGSVCVGLMGKAVYEMYVCGKDKDYEGIFPSEMATYAGLQYAAENDYLFFDMMGAGKPDDGGYGVRDFKLKFGGELLEQGRFVCVCNELLYGIGKLGVKMMKKL